MLLVWSKAMSKSFRMHRRRFTRVGSYYHYSLFIVRFRLSRLYRKDAQRRARAASNRVMGVPLTGDMLMRT